MKKYHIVIFLSIVCSIAAMSCNSSKASNPNINRCPYEGFECPNAQQAIEESRTYDSTITAEAKTLIKINVDKRGLISVTYAQFGQEYALDYLTPVEFKYMFGFTVEHNP